MDSTSSKLLDVLRGIAALFVVFGHTREHAGNIFGLNLTGDSLLEKIILVPTSFAMESVAVFFVLSGFLVGGQVIRQVKKDIFSWHDFLIKRISRLSTVLIPGILVTWLLWQFVSQYINNPAWDANSSYDVAVCNALFLQEAHCENYANNLSLWSLSYEFWFYIVFAAIATAFAAGLRKNVYRMLLSIIITMCSISLFGVQLLVLFPAWLIGVFVSYIDESKITVTNKLSPGVLLVLCTASLGICMLISNILGLGRDSLTLFISIPSALVIFSIIRTEELPKPVMSIVNLFSKIGHWSFSIYVFHLPVVMLLLVLAKEAAIAQGLPLAVITYITAVTAIPVTVALWYLTEKHTPTVRDSLYKVFGNPSQKKSQPS